MEWVIGVAAAVVIIALWARLFRSVMAHRNDDGPPPDVSF